jgi:hypothetical protein
MISFGHEDEAEVATYIRSDLSDNAHQLSVAFLVTLLRHFVDMRFVSNVSQRSYPTMLLGKSSTTFLSCPVVTFGLRSQVFNFRMSGFNTGISNPEIVAYEQNQSNKFNTTRYAFNVRGKRVLILTHRRMPRGPLLRVLSLSSSAADKAFAHSQDEHIRVRIHHRFLHLAVNVSTFRLIGNELLRQVLNCRSLEWRAKP